MKSTINFYIAVFFRRFHYFMIVFLLVSAAALTMARILPPVYQSETSLLIESSQIPGELAAPTVETAGSEELQIIEQRLMTRANLLAIARSQNVFRENPEFSADQIVKRMRQGTSIRRTAGRGQATLMTLSFRSDNGATAAGVINQYVTLILRDNAELRADRAGGTLQFFEFEVDQLRVKLDEQGSIILDFKNANAGALPDTLEYRLNQRSILQERLSSADREIDSLTEQRRRLIEIFNATGSLGSASNTALSPEQQVLAQLQDDLRRAMAIYSEENPKVKLLQAQIAQQLSIVAGLPEGQSTGVAPMTILDINLADIDARADLLSSQKEQINAQLETLNSTIEKTPANSIRLGSLDRDYANIQRQYDTAVDRLSKAATGERIELLSKGQRIAVLDPPTVPSEPTSPNRFLISVGGVMLGAALGFALVGLLELLNSSIRRPADIVRHLGISPIATVPYIRTPMEMVVRRAIFVAVFATVIFGVPAALFAIHTYYYPLDLLYDRIAERVGDVI